MKALFAQKALNSSSPILPQAAFPALPARGGAAGRLDALLRNLSDSEPSVARVLAATLRFVIPGNEHRLRGNVATGHGLSGFIIEETAAGHGLV